MYVLYEHHMDKSGEIFTTDMLMTSVFPGKNWINFKNRNEEGIFLHVKKIFKDTHISKYSYDDSTKVWSFLGEAGRVIYDKLKDSPFILLKILMFEPVEDLIGQATAHSIHKPKSGSVKYNPKDFFYQQAAVQSTVLTKEQIASNLAKLLLISDTELLRSKKDELKRSYRQRALVLHPDRTGDGVAMSELNSWWQQYQQYLSA